MKPDKNFVLSQKLLFFLNFLRRKKNRKLFIASNKYINLFSRLLSRLEVDFVCVEKPPSKKKMGEEERKALNKAEKEKEENLSSFRKRQRSDEKKTLQESRR